MAQGKQSNNSDKAALPKSLRSVLLPLIVLVIGATALGAGIGIWKIKAGPDSSSPETSASKLPTFVYGTSAPKGTPKAYQAALDYPEEFDKVPCYCSCGQSSAKHENLRDCFISAGSGGGVKFSSHGANCTICVEEALDVQQAKAEGKSIKDIRAMIDNKYGGSKFGTPTPTPAV